MFSFLKAMLFKMDPEQAHWLALRGLALAYRCRLTSLLGEVPDAPRQVMNLMFPNPIGLAAGFDKNADYVDALASLGFGFIEVGTLTPRPQAGNPRPRLFRLTEQEAIINRMGFNNKGVEYAARRLAQTRYRGILGINIGKNKETPLGQAVDDYLFGFRHLWPYASYITINISSPNTPGLRALAQEDKLTDLLYALKQEQSVIHHRHQKYVPLVVKISPDLTEQALEALAAVLLQQQIDGVIATNTTLHREGVESSPVAQEAGGLSGRPLQARSTRVIQTLSGVLQNHIPIIASGGVMDGPAAREKFQAGASLLQVYTGFIFSGPPLVRSLVGAAPCL